MIEENGLNVKREDLGMTLGKEN